MPRVVFVHGLANKPKQDVLVKLWTSALAGARGDGLDLDHLGVGYEMTYWADVLYPAPEPDSSEGEEVRPIEDDDRSGADSLDWTDGLAGEQREFVEGLRARLDASATEVRRRQADEEAATGERAIPLPKPLERKLMGKLVRDAHHYLYGATVEPRPGERFDVKQELRRRFAESLQRAVDGGRPVVVVSHSMGTMIAYDCLRHVPGGPRVDGLITLGSPLGLSEVQDGWGRQWSSGTGFPSERLPEAGWLNFYDRLDVVCALDPKLANDYKRDGASVIEDARVRNVGTWRHHIREYLARDSVRAALRRLLGL